MNVLSSLLRRLSKHSASLNVSKPVFALKLLQISFVTSLNILNTSSPRVETSQAKLVNRGLLDIPGSTFRLEIQ